MNKKVIVGKSFKYVVIYKFHQFQRFRFMYILLALRAKLFMTK